MSDTLTRICADKYQEIARRKKITSFAALEDKAKYASKPRGFLKALEATVASGRYGLIAEIKKASPSKGLIRADFDPPFLAKAYAQGGATCLSVLTDEPYFAGKDEYLVAARNAVSLPVLRKDFTLDPYQIVEARALGADCILLIVAALNDDELRSLAHVAHTWDMDILVEVHNREELDRALKLDAKLIGINNRNLKTLAVDLQVTEDLAPHIPQDRMIVAESGLFKTEDLIRMAKVNARCFLIGESLMRQEDVAAATKYLLNAKVQA